MRKQFYKDLSDELLRITDPIGEGEEITQVPVIKHIDLWNEQFNPDYKGPAIQFPAVFIRFMPIGWKQMGNKVQCADMQFQLMICTSSLAASKESGSMQDRALTHFDLIDRIFQRLSYFSGNYFGTLLRTQSDTDHYHNEVSITTETYMTHVFDNSAQPETEEVEMVELLIRPVEYS